MQQDQNYVSDFGSGHEIRFKLCFMWQAGDHTSLEISNKNPLFFFFSASTYCSIGLKPYEWKSSFLLSACLSLCLQAFLTYTHWPLCSVRLLQSVCVCFKNQWKATPSADRHLFSFTHALCMQSSTHPWDRITHPNTKILHVSFSAWRGIEFSLVCVCVCVLHSLRIECLSCFCLFAARMQVWMSLTWYAGLVWGASAVLQGCLLVNNCLINWRDSFIFISAMPAWCLLAGESFNDSLFFVSHSFAIQIEIKARKCKQIRWSANAEYVEHLELISLKAQCQMNKNTPVRTNNQPLS